MYRHGRREMEYQVKDNGKNKQGILSCNYQGVIVGKSEVDFHFFTLRIFLNV